MNPLVFIEAPLAVKIHVVAATVALLIGAVTIIRKRRDRVHRTMGYIWVSALVVVCMSSFGISETRMIGPFGPIHLLSVYALWGVFVGLSHIRNGRIRQHEATMKAV